MKDPYHVYTLLSRGLGEVVEFEVGHESGDAYAACDECDGVEVV